MAANVNHLIFAAGYVCHLLSGLLRIGLASAFVIGTFRWSLSPWWSWPIAVAAAVMLSCVGKLLMATSDALMLQRDSSREGPGSRAAASHSAMSPAAR
jgi:hypothetical protein